MDSLSYNHIAAILGYVSAAVAVVALLISAYLAWNTMRLYRQNSESVNAKNKDTDKAEVYAAVREYNNYLRTVQATYNGNERMDIAGAVEILQVAQKNKYAPEYATDVDTAYKLLNSIYEHYFFIIETCNAVEYVSGKKDDERNFRVSIKSSDEKGGNNENVRSWEPLEEYFSIMRQRIRYIRNFANVVKFKGDMTNMPKSTYAPLIEEKGGKAIKSKLTKETMVDWHVKANISVAYLNHTDRLFAKAIAAGKRNESGDNYRAKISEEEFWDNEVHEKERVLLMHKVIATPKSKKAKKLADVETQKAISIK